jgi:hypothetical protein
MSRQTKSNKPRRAKLNGETRLADQSYSPTEFARAESLSVGMVYKMWGQGEPPWGLGPRYYLAGNRRRISEQARRDWQREREAAAASKQVGETKQARRKSKAAASARLGV